MIEKKERQMSEPVLSEGETKYGYVLRTSWPDIKDSFGDMNFVDWGYSNGYISKEALDKLTTSGLTSVRQRLVLQELLLKNNAERFFKEFKQFLKGWELRHFVESINKAYSRTTGNWRFALKKRNRERAAAQQDSSYRSRRKKISRRIGRSSLGF